VKKISGSQQVKNNLPGAGRAHFTRIFQANFHGIRPRAVRIGK
jgi:hypothetical protein